MARTVSARTLDPLLPLMAAGVAWVATQATVRRWLRRLP